MAKKPSTTSLSFRDLVLGAEADILRQALEARVRIDELVAERQEAYARIAALETQIEDVIGEPGVFPFPAPPLPIAGIDPKAESLVRSATAAAKKAPARSTATTPESDAVLDDAHDPDTSDMDANDEDTDDEKTNA